MRLDHLLSRESFLVLLWGRGPHLPDGVGWRILAAPFVCGGWGLFYVEALIESSAPWCLQCLVLLVLLWGVGVERLGGSGVGGVHTVGFPIFRRVVGVGYRSSLVPVVGVG